MLSGMKHLRSGKVRELFELGDNLLIVASDRISAFDFVLPDEIPGKGKVLTSLSLFWFSFLDDIVKNHLITADVDKMPVAAHQHKHYLSGRSMYVRRAKVFPVECIVRGYLSGSGWRDYRRTGSVCGIKLPNGLMESSKLSEPIFTPSTKADVGHDENITFELATNIIGTEVMTRLKSLSISIYTKAADFAAERGIIIADTKFEFGQLPDGEIILIDEVLTPDSSRFWPADGYLPGNSQPSFDKQIVRDYLNTLDWDKNSPPPTLPRSVIDKTIDKYRLVTELLIG